MRKSVLIRIDQEHYETLQSIAKQQERSLASLVRVVLNDFIAVERHPGADTHSPEPLPSRDWQAKVYGGKQGEPDVKNNE